MDVKVTMLPSNLRTEFEMARMATSYRDRLLVLCTGVVNAKALRDEFNSFLRPVFHKWDTYNKVALEESTKGLSPSERSKVSAKIEFI